MTRSLNLSKKITELIKEIKYLKITVTELKEEIRQLKSTSNCKTPGVFQPGDKVTIVMNGVIGKAGDKATVTRVGKRISLVLKGGNHTNRAPNNIKHDD